MSRGRENNSVRTDMSRHRCPVGDGSAEVARKEKKMPLLHHFIPFESPFSVTTSSKEGIYDLPITTHGVHVHGDSKYTYTHYAGEAAVDSYTEFILPSDPVFLRSFADGIVEYAKKLEEKKKLT